MVSQPAPLNPTAEEQNATLAKRWTSLNDKAGQIARMADLAAEPDAIGPKQFCETLLQSSKPAQNLAICAFEDIELLVEMGLKALKNVEARGQDTHAPALALWREYYHARAAIFSALEPVAA